MKSVLINMISTLAGLYAAVGILGMLAGLALSGEIERREWNDV